MAWQVRAATAQDVPALVRADWAAFGNQPSEDQIEMAAAFLEVDRTLVAVDDERVVGTAGALSLELTVPGPATVATAGVTYVGVLPTHRRQGILTALMARLMDDAHRRREPVAALLASESTIYRRFGFGIAVLSCSVEVERPFARLRSVVDPPGRLRMLDPAHMADALPPVHDRYRRLQPGEVSRPSSWWARRLHEPRRQGVGEPRFAVLWEGDDGTPEGYVTYRIQDNWDGGLPGHTLEVEDLVATDPRVRARLWRYCFDVDLVRLVRVGATPVDDPLRWMLEDPRRLRVTGVGDFLWIRMLDVAAALGARTYASDAELVIEVADPCRPDVSGRYRLVGRGDRAAECRRTDDPADLVLDVADLASAYLGAVRFATLARAGLVSEVVPGALARADSLFATASGPASSTGF